MLNRENAHLDVPTTFFPKKSSQNLGFISGIVSRVGVAALALATNGCSPEDISALSQDPQEDFLQEQNAKFDSLVESTQLPVIEIIDDTSNKKQFPINKPKSLNQRMGDNEFKNLAHKITSQVMDLLDKNPLPKNLPDGTSPTIVRHLVDQIKKIFEGSDKRVAEDLSGKSLYYSIYYMDTFFQASGFSLYIDYDDEMDSMLFSFSLIDEVTYVKIDDGYQSTLTPVLTIKDHVFSNEILFESVSKGVSFAITFKRSGVIKFFPKSTNYIEDFSEWGKYVDEKGLALNERELSAEHRRSTIVHESAHALNTHDPFFAPDASLVYCIIPQEYRSYFGYETTIKRSELDELIAQSLTLAFARSIDYPLEKHLNSTEKVFGNLPLKSGHLALPDKKMQRAYLNGDVNIGLNMWGINETHTLGIFMYAFAKEVQKTCK